MRLDSKKATFIKSGLQEMAEGSEIYLFGSRADDTAKGGDIDVLWLTQSKVSHKKIREFRIKFFKKFGWRKIDIVNFTFQDNDVFKDIALQQAVEL